MPLTSSTTALASLTIFALTGLAGCFYDNDPPRRLGEGWDDTPGSATIPTRDSEPAKSSPSRPMLVEVDSDQIMEAAGGDGVGVFVEYGRGGHWRIWWTCDTNLTSQLCDFAVTARADTLSEVDASALPLAAVKHASSTRVVVKTLTTRDAHALRFDTAPGDVITVEATIDGLKDGSFFFFVQDGEVNGGFSGKLTNPLQLQGSAP